MGSLRQRVVLPGEGQTYDWTQDRVTVKAAHDLSEGRVTLVEDRLKPGFLLPRHHHRRMCEIFYVLEGVVRFVFADETVDAAPGTTVSVPAGVVHEVSSTDGARLLTVFTPGGFEDYLAELVALPESAYADAALMTSLAERYDIFQD